MEYKEHIDYDIVASTNPAFNKAVVRLNIFKSHRQVNACYPSILATPHRFAGSHWRVFGI